MGETPDYATIMLEKISHDINVMGGKVDRLGTSVTTIATRLEGYDQLVKDVEYLKKIAATSKAFQQGVDSAQEVTTSKQLKKIIFWENFRKWALVAIGAGTLYAALMSTPKIP